MKIKFGHWFFLTLLAVIFTIGLTYASVELPRAINSVLHKSFDFPGFDSSRNPEGTEAFISSQHIRLIGYGSLVLVVILIVVGLVAEKRSLSSVGAIAFFLPVFGHFAMSMFFLAGLGILRVIWMPVLDISYDMLRLGDVSYIPYMIAVYIPALIRIDIRTPFAYVLMGLGILAFILGTLAWFYARFQKKGMADFWLYRLSRHPQYLGWILWSYGFMIYVSLHSTLYRFKIGYGIPNSLPWLLSTLVIVGVALVEEINMKRERGEEYDLYSQRTPFMLPLPRLVSRIIAAPMRLVLRKKRPESGMEVAVTLALYAAILILLSVPFVVFHFPYRTGWWGFPYNVFPFR